LAANGPLVPIINGVFNIPTILPQQTTALQTTANEQEVKKEEGTKQNDSPSTEATTQRGGDVPGNSNLSNDNTQNKTQVFDNFKDKEHKAIDLEIKWEDSLKNLDIQDEDKKEYNEHKEKVNKRLEEHYIIKIQTEDYNNKVNTSYYNSEFDISNVLKPLLGEHHLGGVKIPFIDAGYSA